MVERIDDTPLTLILKAASEPTRRAILTHLAQEGPARVTEIAARFDFSLNAVSKHIMALERAGLVSRTTHWREHLIEVQMAPLGEIDRWFNGLRSIWTQRLELLEALITTEDTAMSDLSLTCRHTFKASAERIYNAWLDPAMMIRYMTMGPDMVARDASCDPRVGGRFRFTMVGEKENLHTGTYRELTPYSRITFTWEAPWSTPGSLVDITLTPVEGGTEVVLTHVKFTSEESRDGHFKGWTGILSRLDGFLT
jgi:uncharacterized protein YndB with AHSA1/START domain/DNA-binding transcriptional ArsR family regulator